MKNIKRVLSSILAIVIIVSSLTAINVFAAGTNLVISVTNEVKVGDEIKCDVDLSGNTGWGALQFDIVYDSNVMEYVSCSNGTALNGASSSITDKKGVVTAVLYTGGDNITSDGNIIQITFKAVGIGSSDLKLELSDFYDTDLNVVECSLKNGFVVVKGENDSTTETTTKTVTTEKQTESTTKAVTTEKQTETTTKAVITTTEKQTESTTKVATTEKTTETTTKTVVTESSTETTTKKPSSGGSHSSGAGASGISVKGYTNTTTTETVTEATTVKAESTTEVTTTEEVKLSNVKVTIGKKSVVIGDKTYDIDVAPYIQASSNSTLVPLRFVALAIADGDVDNADNSSNITWDTETKTASIKFNGNVIKFTAGSDTMLVNDKPQFMENGVKAEITDGRMFVPFRALGNALGANVEWNTSTKTAIYKIK